MKSKTMEDANVPVNADYGKLRAVDYLLLPYVIARLLRKYSVQVSLSEYVTQSIAKIKYGRLPNSPSSIYREPTPGETLNIWLI